MAEGAVSTAYFCYGGGESILLLYVMVLVHCLYQPLLSRWRDRRTTTAARNDDTYLSLSVSVLRAVDPCSFPLPVKERNEYREEDCCGTTLNSFAPRGPAASSLFQIAKLTP
ncbi:hypothetical protein B296_00032460 [Ensete ventricosum]|uniref:Uncharacterized protein n=1 Tax=Ensete ventricosum TaxID=4639 RepID=A0A426Z7F3_ENSVE|nr:hypothetical protein B296_00032460 [Ensete ventricosum]